MIRIGDLGHANFLQAGYTIPRSICANLNGRGNIMRKLLLASVFVVAGLHSALASDVAFEDMIGRWCVVGLGNINTFSKTQLFVQTPKGNSRTVEILKTQVDGNRIRIDFTIRPDAYTVYELSADRRTLIQIPNSGGDMGPRYELHRC
jgi:hypothetical protein